MTYFPLHKNRTENYALKNRPCFKGRWKISKVNNAITKNDCA